jgi:mediator of RNA polymerase II transcription subunit 25
MTQNPPPQHQQSIPQQSQGNQLVNQIPQQVSQSNQSGIIPTQQMQQQMQPPPQQQQIQQQPSSQQQQQSHANVADSTSQDMYELKRQQNRLIIQQLQQTLQQAQQRELQYQQIHQPVPGQPQQQQQQHHQQQQQMPPNYNNGIMHQMASSSGVQPFNQVRNHLDYYIDTLILLFIRWVCQCNSKMSLVINKSK